MPADVKLISADLAPFVFDPKIGLALLVITAVDAKVLPTNIESGTVHARVVETFRPDTPPAGATVTFPFARDADEMARERRGANTWNTLRLEPDARLLVAWAPVDAPRGEYTLVAAASEPEKDGADVSELREAVAIQALPADEPKRPERLSAALLTGKGILRRYACAAVGPRKLVARAEGVRMLGEAIDSARTGPDDDLALADTLMEKPLFDPDLGSDDEPNIAVLTTLAKGLTGADPEHAGSWLRCLYSRVMPEFSEDPDEDWVHRRGFLRAIGVGTELMNDRLGTLAATPGPDAPLASELLTAWRKARKN